MLTLSTSALVLLGLMPGAPSEAIANGPSDMDVQAMAAFGLTAAQVLPVSIEGVRGQVTTARLSLGGKQLEFLMEPNQVLSPEFRLLEDRGSGHIVEVDYVAPATYGGSVRNQFDSQVTMTWLEDGLWGRFELEDGSRWWMQPVGAAVDGAGLDDHVFYRVEDVIPSGGTCGVDLLPNGGYPDGYSPAPLAPPSSNASAGTDPPYIAELGCDADFEFYQDYGSNSTSVMNRITSVINAINTQYENEVGIQHLITTILVRTSSNDPYTSSDAITLLNEFVSEWNANQGGIQRDVAQLYTGRNIQGGTIGIAFVATLCSTSQAYSVVESDCCGAFSCTTDLSAHELGHNWSANHCTCNGFTMNPFITCGNQFTVGQTIPKIIRFRDTLFCLDGGPDPRARFSGTPRSGVAPLTVAFNEFSDGTGLSAWSWDFGDGTTSTQMDPSHTYVTPGTYDVSLTVTGALGVNTMTEVDYVTVDVLILASCTDRLGTGANPDIFD
ncbi:MAG: PKD repeat protein, partial [Planctomycetota bacterium]